MALSSEILETARKRLDEELIHIQTELDELGFPVTGTVEVTFDEGFADAAQATSERAKVLSIADGLRERFEDCQAALGRIDKGTYGTCESCGQAIGTERLDALPAARLCITCKQKAS